MRRYGILFLVGLMFLAACSRTLQHTASELPVDPSKIPRFRAVGPVRLVNAQTLAPDVVLSAYVNIDVSINYRQYTDAVLRALKLQLEKNGAKVQDAAQKTLKLAINDIKILDHPGFWCIVNYTVETGEGYRHGFRVTEVSGHIPRAIDGALAKVVAGVLQNEEILKYVEK